VFSRPSNLPTKKKSLLFLYSLFEEGSGYSQGKNLVLRSCILKKSLPYTGFASFIPFVGFGVVVGVQKNDSSLPCSITLVIVFELHCSSGCE
jgi:hypothetical protein